MKTARPSYLLSALMAGAAVVTLGNLATDAEAASITNTKHNLGSSGTVVGQNKVTGGATGEVCVFCHTPHGSDTSAPVPLWNKKLPTTTTYTTYASLNSSTMDAAFATDGTSGTAAIGSVSVACLSCHDGTQAMDNMINAPGSGGYDSTGGGANGQQGATWNWSGSTVVTSNGILTTASGSASLIGVDLKNDHPIGIQYCGGWNGSACTDGDFVTPQSTGSGATAQYWVDTGGAGTRQKTDMILYTRSFGANAAGLAAGYYGSVECASCHDPHAEAKATNQVSFLRVSQTGSGVCLACHVK
jgi:hypothetical protein